MSDFISIPKKDKSGTILIEPFDEKPYMTFHEAAVKIGLTKLTELVNDNKIDYHVVEDHIMVKRKDIEKILNQ